MASEYADAFQVVWNDVAEGVLQRPTPLQTLQHVVGMTEDELRQIRIDDEETYESYLIVRDWHNLNRPDR